ncbi:MAG TPA: TIGR03663 family protein, partial [Anaerolineae bacterium]|nr:TIGR03663 family protein [Anaerolineae bacterium]
MVDWGGHPQFPNLPIYQFPNLPTRSEDVKDWNVEKAAYAAIGLLAAALRLFQLGLRPLSEGEAAQALAAFRFSQGAASAAPAGTIPALFAGNVLGFSLMGANDLTARWLPALAGLILVLLPYGLRRQLGRGGALAASLLLALSPTAIYFSRNLDGAILVAACGLALIVGLVNYLDTWRPAFLYLSAVALGLGLTAGSGIYAWLLIVAAFGLLLYVGSRFLHRDWGWSALAGGWLAARAEAGLPVRLGATLAATFGLVATVLALYPGGMGHAADLLAAWLTGFAPGHNPQPYIYPWLLLLRYEPLILALGLIEMGRWLVSRTIHRPKTVGQVSNLPNIEQDTSWTPFWVFWAAVALLLLPLSGQRAAGNTLLAVTPLALLAGQGVARAWRWISRRALWAEAGLMAGAALVLGGFFYLQLAAYSQAVGSIPLELLGTDLPTATSYLLLAGAAVLLLFGLGVIAWMWRSPDLIVAGGWLALVVALGAFGFKAAWSLNVAHAADARELMAGGWATAPDVRALVDHLEALSLEKSG